MPTHINGSGEWFVGSRSLIFETNSRDEVFAPLDPDYETRIPLRGREDYRRASCSGINSRISRPRCRHCVGREMDDTTALTWLQLISYHCNFAYVAVFIVF